MRSEWPCDCDLKMFSGDFEILSIVRNLREIMEENSSSEDSFDEIRVRIKILRDQSDPLTIAEER